MLDTLYILGSVQLYVHEKCKALWFKILHIDRLLYIPNVRDKACTKLSLHILWWFKLLYIDCLLYIPNAKDKARTKLDLQSFPQFVSWYLLHCYNWLWTNMCTTIRSTHSLLISNIPWYSTTKMSHWILHCCYTSHSSSTTLLHHTHPQ